MRIRAHVDGKSRKGLRKGNDKNRTWYIFDGGWLLIALLTTVEVMMGLLTTMAMEKDIC